MDDHSSQGKEPRVGQWSMGRTMGTNISGRRIHLYVRSTSLRCSFRKFRSSCFEIITLNVTTVILKCEIDHEVFFHIPAGLFAATS